MKEKKRMNHEGSKFNKKHKAFLVCLCALSVFVVQTKAQDFHFSQFYEMPILRNPALAGVFKGDMRMAAVHRSQWQSVTVPFQTSAANIEYKLPVFNFNDYVTIGAQVVHDVAGDIKLKRTQLFPVLNFHKSLSEDEDNYLSLAFMGGPVTSQFDPTQAKMDDQFVNGSFSSGNASRQVFSGTGFTYWDASTGISYSSGFGYESRYYIGVGYFHFLKPRMNFFSNNSETYLQSKWVFNAGLNTPTGDNSRLIGFADYFVQGGHRQFLGGALYEMDVAEYYNEDEVVSLALGAFYRWNDAVIPVVRLRYFKWNLGLSYDANVSKLKTASQMRGGFELTASFRGFLNTRNSSAEKLRCVAF
ncbi:PorP/SprF family type IX secretion system membrane protein [Aridibaculum aurantiacum]|uniref:PorP/SprF family type IX secretion system membrane protein n=1 Tax=Aridibaculum aurantiacum TaxID=2810307 RepID=UPI001A97AE19|nr:PorP/SprF family type IX secretion system membrane protein [Aridibaculum aurantiacum]